MLLLRLLLGRGQRALGPVRRAAGGPPGQAGPGGAGGPRGLADAGGTVPRFYKRSTVRAAGDGEWGVQLDQHPLKTPAQKPLVFPQRALAAAIAAEWEWQEANNIRPYTMPLMQLCSTAIDRMPLVRQQTIDNMLEYLETDQVLCREPAGTEIAGIQEENFADIVAWAEAEFDVELNVSDSLLGTPQAEATAEKLREAMVKLDDFGLVAIDQLAGSCRSILLGFAAMRGKIDIDRVLELARLEEEFQIKEWGMVEGGHDISRAEVRVAIASPLVMLQLLALG